MKAVILVVIVGIAIGLYLKQNQTDSRTPHDDGKNFQANWSAENALKQLTGTHGFLMQCLDTKHRGRFVHPQSSMPGSEHHEFLHPILSSGNPSTDLVIDVGANIGAIGLFSASYGYKTVMVEPIPHNIQILASAIICNNFTNAALVTRPASNTSSASVDISDNVSNGQFNGQILQQGQAVEHNVHTVKVVRLDDIIPNDLPVLLLKLDVEGYEALAFKGLEGLLENGMVKYIHTEFAPGNILAVSGIHGEEYLELLWKYNFRVFVEDCSHNIDHDAREAIAPLCPNAYATSILSSALVNLDFDRIRKYEVTEANAKNLVAQLSTCKMGGCMVNLAAVRSAAHE